MIIVADFYRYGNEHVPVNASLLLIICNHYQQSHVTFFAEESHLEKVKAFWRLNNIQISNITWSPSSIQIKATGTKLVFERIKNELSFLNRLNKKQTKGLEKVFFLSLSPFPTIMYKLFYGTKKQTLITLHGDVEFARLQNSFSRNVIGRLFRISFKIKKDNCKYLVLNHVIKQNLVKEGFLKEDEIIGVYHPYIFHQQLKAKPYTTPIKFAHIGVASIEKRTYFLYEIAEHFKTAIHENKMQLEVIGKNENIEIKPTSELIKGIENTCMLERSDFEAKLIEVDYAIFFYSEAYQLTGSGALMDALDFEKPVIALRNELFNTFFEDAGNIGFLCDSIEEMKSVIESIIQGKVTESDYRQMQYSIQKFKHNFSLSHIEDKLFKQLNWS